MNREIIEGNKLIAEFMQDRIALNCIESGQDLEYHESWDWLMPVIEKIGAFKYEDGETAYPRTFGMIDELGQPMFRFNRHQLFHGKTLIVAAWLATVDFIK